MSCIVLVPGCELCETHPHQSDPDHFCAAVCEIGVDMISTPKGHAAIHAPLRHQCGFVLDDRRGNKFHGKAVPCAFKVCVQFFCPGCRRYDMGWGGIGCPCDTRAHGHGTRAEFARPSVRRLVKRRGH